VPLLLDQVPASAIANAVHSVFLERAFAKLTLQQRFMEFLSELARRVLGWLAPAFRAMRYSTPVFWLAVAVAAVVVLALVASVVLEWRARRLDVARARTWNASPYGAGGRDPWEAAQALAGSGAYTEAAHALYAALLDAAARQQQVRLHPSKTVGDYARELRSRSSALFGLFRDFGRVYEVVVYGLGQCDEARYERLLALASPVVRPRG